MEKVMKKIGLLICLLSSWLIQPVFADEWVTHWPESIWKKEWRTNFLIGIFGGYADRESNLTTTMQYGGFPVIPQSIVVRDVSDTGGIYGFLLGFHGRCNKWLFGGEFNIENHNFSEDHPFAFSDPAGLVGWNGTSEYQRDWMAGFTFRLGYQIVDYLLPYVRLGVETGRDKLITTLTPDDFDGSLRLQDKTWIYRFLSGVGIEFPVYCTAITMRLEYQFHSKGKTIETDRLFTDGIFNPISTSQMQPRTQTGLIAIVRNFDLF
jgi:opacity protein-like surface antigen